MSSRQRRIGIIGLGPKGLYALERLGDRLHDIRHSPVVLHLFEPHPTPGAGPVYDPSQPEHLRMNFRSEHVDMWPRSEGARLRTRPSFLEWARDRHPRWSAPHEFPPRALVGAYLHEGFQRVVAELPASADLHIHRARVQTLPRTGTEWQARGRFGAVALDEVLVATGHASRSAAQRPPPLPSVVPQVYPVDRWLSPGRIPPGSVVAVRGFGLTALDAILTLGGSEPSRRPLRIHPYSRSGRPMQPKLEPAASTASHRELEWIRTAGAEHFARAVNLEGILDALVRCAGEVLERRGWTGNGCERGREACRRHLRELLSRPKGRIGGEPVWNALTRGLGEARGTRLWGPERALGETWRGVYPTLVAVLGDSRLCEMEYPRFRRLAREMERLAFGPPAKAVEKLLGMVQSGLVDLTFLDSPHVRMRSETILLSTSARSASADRLVDAVLDPPGAAPDGSSLLTELLRDGHIRTEAGTHGVEVRPDGSAVGRDGATTPGLAVIGRPTEGRVLGNDTLSRTLHDHPQRWADKVSRGAR